MRAIIESLSQLQELETGSDPQSPDVAEKIGGLRREIPAPVLAHYDRFRVRGKKGVALVRNQVCTACHVGLATGVLATLRNGADIQLCGNCGRYLQLAPGEDVVLAPPVSAAKTAKKKRRAKP